MSFVNATAFLIALPFCFPSNTGLLDSLLVCFFSISGHFKSCLAFVQALLCEDYSRSTAEVSAAGYSPRVPARKRPKLSITSSISPAQALEQAWDTRNSLQQGKKHKPTSFQLNTRPSLAFRRNEPFVYSPAEPDSRDSRSKRENKPDLSVLE